MDLGYIWNEYFAWGEHVREAEGYLSFEHLLSSTLFVGTAIALAIILGIKMKNKTFNEKLKVIKISGPLMVGFEIVKIIIQSIRVGNFFEAIIGILPLFLCSIQLIAIPVAGYSKGRLQEGTLDFVFIFGLLGCILGIYFAGNLYATIPVIHFDTLVSATTHSIAGFTSLYIGVSGLATMKKKNMWIPILILLFFMLSAEVVNVLTEFRFNYMFLARPDGTPFSIVYDLFKGNKVLYPIGVVLLMSLYAVLFDLIYFLVRDRKNLKKKGPNEKKDSSTKQG